MIKTATGIQHIIESLTHIYLIFDFNLTDLVGDVSMTGDAQLARNKLSSLTERRIVGS
jgi:hypothetical protein